MTCKDCLHYPACAGMFKKTWGELPETGEGAERCETFIDRTKYTVREKSEWIPVTERLPEKAGDYLVFSKAGNYSIQYFYIDGSYKAFLYAEVGTITHWMPLPEPPKEGE